MSVGDDVMISVDPHKASNTLVVMDPVTKAVIARQRFANSAGGYRRLREFAGGWADRRWAVEGCHARAERWRSAWWEMARWCSTCRPS